MKQYSLEDETVMYWAKLERELDDLCKKAHESDKKQRDIKLNFRHLLEERQNMIVYLSNASIQSSEFDSANFELVDTIQPIRLQYPRSPGPFLARKITEEVLEAFRRLKDVYQEIIESVEERVYAVG